jgi:antitoxin HigA-1
MASSKKKLPPVHPGEALREINRVTAILSGQRGITADTAFRLGRYFGTSAQMWMNLQSTYELETAEDALSDRILRKVMPRPAA